MVPVPKRPNKAVFLCAAVSTLLFDGGPARAHAVLAAFNTNRCVYIVVRDNRIELRYTVAVGPLPGARIRTSADEDKNGTLSVSEIRRFKETLPGMLKACVAARHEGRPAPLRISLVEVRFDGSETGTLPIWIQARLAGEKKTTGSWVLEDRCRFPGLGTHEFLFHPGPSVRIKGLSADRKASVRKGQVLFPAGATNCTARFEVAPGKGQGGAPAGATHRLSRSSSILWDLVRHGTSVPFLLGATLLAFLLGAYHALSPGHGKTVVAAYLVGSRATTGQAALLAGTVTFTHTFSIALLGVAVILVFGDRVPDYVFPYLNLGSGLAIAAVGVYLLVRGSHRHAHHEKPDSKRGDRAILGGLLTLGVTGGLVPCPTALVVLLLAISQGRTVLGLYLVAVFGLGLAAVLMVIGIVAVKARTRLDRWSRARALTAWLPRLSASVILVVGLLIAGGPLWAMLYGT